MNLNEYEKYKVYQEEVSKRKLLDKEDEISEIEKKEILKEYNKKNICLITGKDIILPNLKFKKKENIIGYSSSILVLWFFGFIYWVLFLLAYMSILFYLRLKKGIGEEKILLNLVCPTCQSSGLNVLDEKGYDLFKKGTVDWYCRKCNVNMDLLLSEDAVTIIEANKEHI